MIPETNARPDVMAAHLGFDSVKGAPITTSRITCSRLAGTRRSSDSFEYSE